MTVDKDDVTLTLQDTEISDAGTYKLEASNKLGSVNTECTVDVQGRRSLAICNRIAENGITFLPL